MQAISAEKEHIAFCGLYCGACASLLKGKCPGCRKNSKASWCKVRACCMNNNYASCADCREFNDTKDCRILNNMISKIIGLVTGSDRNECVKLIRDMGYDGFAKYMAENRLQSMKKVKNV